MSEDGAESYGNKVESASVFGELKARKEELKHKIEEKKSVDNFVEDTARIMEMPNDEQKVAATYAVLRENEDLMNSNKEHFAKTSVSFAFSEKGTEESGTTILKVEPDKV